MVVRKGIAQLISLLMLLQLSALAAFSDESIKHGKELGQVLLKPGHYVITNVDNCESFVVGVDANGKLFQQLPLTSVPVTTAVPAVPVGSAAIPTTGQGETSIKDSSHLQSFLAEKVKKEVERAARRDLQKYVGKIVH